MPGKFDGKRVLITGGGSGIGREIARSFLEAGARVIICGRRHGPLKATVDELKAHAGNLHFVECDISDPDDVDALVKRTGELIGGLDILVNNAGITEQGTLDSTELRTFDRVMNVNLRGVFVVTKACLPLLRQAGRGSCVLNISSTLGQAAEEHTLVYSVSKAALDHFTRCCALDFAPEGIRFNAVAPGVVDTPMQDRVKGELGYQEWRHQMEQLHPLGSIGLPKDVAAAGLFLCSPDAEWITGVIMPVDGGITAR
ncbi:MAG: SDR family oxidoreductase [Planctomycetes bacterium]|nr:SDR family oxidoreductase [Planctomycetota bacterium]